MTLCDGRSVTGIGVGPPRRWPTIWRVRPIWAWGGATASYVRGEPVRGAWPQRPKRQSRRSRGPYTEDEARKLLAAPCGDDASFRWLPWALCFTGARLGEVTQAVKEDIQGDGRVALVRSYSHRRPRANAEDGPAQTDGPVHAALIAEGFLHHVQGLPAVFIFGDLNPDKFGTLKGTATKKHGCWVRRTVGITDKTKDPAHAWRHRFEDQARRAGVPQNVTDGLMGHLNATNESEGYGRGFRFVPDATAPWLDKMASPLQAPIAVPSGPLLSRPHSLPLSLRPLAGEWPY